MTKKKPKKSTRTRTRFHSAWRVDSDYKKKLGTEARKDLGGLSEREWMEKFEAEFYRCEFGKEPLHDEQARSDLYTQQNTAWADVVTQTSDVVAEHLAKPLKNPTSRRHTYYSPDDYMDRSVGNAEDALIEAIDLKKSEEVPATEDPALASSQQPTSERLPVPLIVKRAPTSK